MRLSRVVSAAISLLILFAESFSQVDSRDSARVDSSFSNIDILAIAHNLAKTTFSGFRYGSNSSRKQVDCSQFMQAVVEKILGRELTEGQSRAVLIAGLPSGVRTLDSLINADDDRITGVQYALTTVIPIGKIVPVDSAKTGDLIQYWIKSSSGHYKGHTAIIETVDRQGNIPTVTLYGSHKTLGRIGTAVDRSGKTLKLKLSGRDRKVYLVRIDSELLHIFFARQSTAHGLQSEH